MKKLRSKEYFFLENSCHIFLEKIDIEYIYI